MPRSLRRRVVGLVAVAVLPVLLGAIGFLAFAADNILRDRACRELALRAQDVANNASGWDHYMVLALESLRELPEVQTMEPARQAPVLAQIRRVYGDLIMIGVAGPNGVCVARSDAMPPLDYHDRDWFKGAMSGRPISRQTVLSKSTGNAAVAYASPVRNEAGRVVGAAFCTMDERQIAARVGAGRFGRSGYCLVVDEKGLVVASPEAHATSLTPIASLAPIGEAIYQHADHQGVFRDPQGIDWI